MTQPIKHYGIIKETGSKVVIPFLSLPGAPEFALVVELFSLTDALREEIWGIVNSNESRNAKSLADVLDKCYHHGGQSLLVWLHQNGKLRKIPSNEVLLTPTPDSQELLSTINDILFKQAHVLDGLSDEQIAENKSLFEQRRDEYKKSQAESMASSLDFEATELEAQAKLLIESAARKRVEAKRFLDGLVPDHTSE